MYKLKFLIPIKVRLLFYHSFVQSRLNFCSLIWGFAAKSFINEFFIVQKKSVRAVMPGFVRYFYKDGVIPTHTKSAFSEYKILTVHNIIAKNALLLMSKITNVKGMLPTSIENLFPANAPNFNFKFRDSLTSSKEIPMCQTWLENYNSISYRKSLFFRGPMLYKEFFREYQKQELGLLIFNREKSYSSKNTITKFLVKCQSSGDPDDWQVNNNFLDTVSGPRTSNRNKT